MNINKAYNIFKNILSGCKTMVDAFYFVDKIIKLCPESRELLIGMIYNKKYDKSFDIRSMAYTLNRLDLLKKRSEVDEFIDNNIKNYLDQVQLNSFLRLSKTKENDVLEDIKPTKINFIQNIFSIRYSFLWFLNFYCNFWASRCITVSCAVSFVAYTTITARL